MLDGFNFTIVSEAEWIEIILKTMFKFVLVKVTHTKLRPS